MQQEEVTLSIPLHLQPEAKRMCELLRAALRDSPEGDPNEVRLFKPRSEQLVNGTLDLVLISLGTNAAVWFTKKWFETYAWPALQRVIDRPSKAAVDWIFGECRSDEAHHEGLDDSPAQRNSG